MTLKKVLGASLTILGALALIYGAYIFVTDNSPDWKNLLVTTILGLIFFSAGINLVKGIKDGA